MKNNYFSKSIVRKMFLVNFVALMAIVTLIFFFQSIYLEGFYTRSKIKNLADGLNEFSNSYLSNDWSYEKLSREAQIFSDNNNAQLSVEDLNKYNEQWIDENFVDFGKSFTEKIITIRINDKYYDMYLSEEAIKELNDEKMFKINQKIDIIGYEMPDNIIIPIKINSIIIKSETENDEVGTNKIQGTAIIDKIDAYDNNFYGPEVDFDVVQDIILEDGIFDEKAKHIDDITYNIKDVAYANTKELLMVKRVVKNGESVELFVNASLQPVNEVVGVFKNFYILFYIISALIAIVIAMFYSKFISKPLLRLTHKANLMANMDFKVSLEEEDREDELGDLAKSLNSLSQNLDTALEDLKEANRQLTFDIEKEKKQDDIRKEFVANISHELKTPLSIIKGYAEGIIDGVKKEKREYYMHVILEEIDKMGKLIMSMLDLSKQEYASLDNIEDIDICKLINKSLRSFEVKLSEKNLSVNIEGEYKVVKGNKLNISSVIENLLSNSIKHGLMGSTIDIRGEVKGNKNYVFFRNRGDKIEREDLENIWLRFYKKDKSHNRKGGGTGLGLAIVKAILDKHKSDYGIENRADGVEVYFALDISESN